MRSLGLACQQLKGAWPNVRTESKLPGNKKTQPLVSLAPSLQLTNHREQFLLRLTLFYPIYG